MTGRHRGQPKDRAAEDEMDERAPRGRRVALIVGAFLVPVLAASVIAVGMRDEPARERPETAGTRVQNYAPATPESEPTFGTYVPPDSEPQAATRTPERRPAPVTKPRKTTAPTPSPSPTRVRRPCPAGWQDVWWMRRWCERHGYRER
ncbi:hypothetical protein [Actinomadura monticuli]|uniref:Uncharacterized protein n=1 Tax=Actinomadura monticuli TaxID=3097367 RepID=A0ABV4QCZ4_9ACTN